MPGRDQLGAAGRSLLEPANNAFVHSMHITTLIAALLALAGGFVVLRWMPGRPRQAQAPADREHEAELAIMEQEMLQTAEREG